MRISSDIAEIHIISYLSTHKFYFAGTLDEQEINAGSVLGFAAPPNVEAFTQKCLKSQQEHVVLLV